MSGAVLTFEMSELEAAAELVHRVLPATPQYPWPKLARRTGCTVWVKHESRVAANRGLHMIPSFHRALVAGVASYALELFFSVSDLDAVYVGVGMGSGICGLIAARDLLGLKTEIIGVSAAKAPASSLSFKAGRPVPTPTSLTFADGLATREPHADAIATLCRGAARVLEVTEDEIAAALRIYYDDTHQVAEGAGAAPLAGLLRESEHMAGKKVGLILTGGNIERERLLKVLSGETPQVHPSGGKGH